ncbi:MAG: S26 family signal peptidase [Gammaproteobacteria bacterium]|nr:S26 family signal peptidase [Gammaproteobacteria bacterium]
MPEIFRVHGTSMLPTLRPQDLVLVLKNSQLAAGDVVVADVAPVGLVVKRLRLSQDGQVSLYGDNPQATSTVCDRPISLDSILGRVFLRIRRPLSVGFV